MDAGWIDACGVDDIDQEDVIRFDHAGQTYALIAPRTTATSPPQACVHTRKCIWLMAW
jgi:3-phenylpropionate/trans-cinnamate dioxygenase ferredoxin subunit